MSATRVKCDVCGCEFIHDWLDDDNLDGQLIRYCGPSKKRVDMCSDCIFKMLDYIEKLREEYGYYEDKE
jgi:hypothetical protein